METVAVIVGAGEGRRMGGQCKALLRLGNKPLLCYSLEIMQKTERVDGICVVVPPGLLHYFENEFASTWPCEKVFAWVGGGIRRRDSVETALKQIPGSALWIAVHDVARPFITEELLERVLNAARGSGASVPGVRVLDTTKEVDDKGYVVRSLERERLRAIQTPQVFSAEILRRAYCNAKAREESLTDDASFVERLGVEVAVVQGSRHNIKITLPEDLELARYILEKKKKNSRQEPGFRSQEAKGSRW
jgi:2-C-methyl-D-erythritol 4-phosphate cytidylyltransferase